MSSDRSPDSDSVASPADHITVKSPYRPFPLGAKKDLQEDIDTVVFPDDDSRTAYASAEPSDELQTKWELRVVDDNDPEEVWTTSHGSRVEIYADSVTEDGRELSISPDEAKQKARNSDHFERRN